MTTEKLASLPVAELEAMLAERVWVECAEGLETACAKPTDCDCQGSGRRWLLRGECSHSVKSFCALDWVGCPGYVYSGDYDGLRAAIEAKGWNIVIIRHIEHEGDQVTLRRNTSMVSAVDFDEGITGLQAIQVALLRAVDATEGPYE